MSNMKRKSSTGGTASDAPTESCTEGTTPAAIYIPPNRSNYLALTTSSMPPSAIPTSVPPKLVRVPIHVDDAKDNVFVGIVRALLLTGNVPCGPAEIAAICVKWDVAVSGLGGVTPHSTVSSRISNHFKRCSESRPPRTPLLGVWTATSTSKARYFIDRPGIPVGEMSEERKRMKKIGLPPPRCRQSGKGVGTTRTSARFKAMATNVVEDSHAVMSENETTSPSLPHAAMTVDASSDAAPPTNPTPLLLVPLHVLPVPKPLSRPDSAIELSALDFQPTDGTQKTAPSWSARWMPGQLSEPATPLVPGQLVQTQFQYVVPNYVEG